VIGVCRKIIFPDGMLELFPADQFALTLCEGAQHPERLALASDFPGSPPEFAGAHIHFEAVEAEANGLGGGRHRNSLRTAGFSPGAALLLPLLHPYFIKCLPVDKELIIKWRLIGGGNHPFTVLVTQVRPSSQRRDSA
jgi:hypothetical protein